MATSPATSPKPSPRPRPKPKGILKKSSSSTTASPIAAPIDFPSSFSLTAPTPPAPPQPEPSRLELLAQQEQAARIRLLEKLKATEIRPAVPLATFEILSQFPRSHPPTPPPPSTSTSNTTATTPTATTPAKTPPPIKYTAANPHPIDVSDLLTHLSTFQPSEYLDLIEERNCLDKCGYALCARPRRTHDAPFKITAAGGIARAEDLNKWCSDACAKRGLYLKVQLDNPSYVRGPDGGMVVKLELRKEGGSGAGAGSTGGEKKVTSGAATAVSPRGTETDRNQLAQAMAQLEIDKHKRPPNKKTLQKDRKDASALAGERGDSAGGRLTDFSRVEVTIKESDVDGPAEAPSAPSEDAQGLIEGYKPKFGTVGDGRNAEEGAESDDDDEFFSVRF
ncbi:uncharacterized protein C8A04DRAFT_28957 [Dichotomopilus funicola]|uniref:RNA polymerase II subunit B1 CTD phosphatase RPAP2 homolog n=1 Tax=Dichotomopilus funicola TaxID=1934379 RepID=A0AAN6V242_9PEZI|nr:hypothetical protein C8A04DRAFT_28957 [Dichotomopilus funicola]